MSSYINVRYTLLYMYFTHVRMCKDTFGKHSDTMASAMFMFNLTQSKWVQSCWVRIAVKEMEVEIEFSTSYKEAAFVLPLMWYLFGIDSRNNNHLKLQNFFCFPYPKWGHRIQALWLHDADEWKSLNYIERNSFFHYIIHEWNTFNCWVGNAISNTLNALVALVNTQWCIRTFTALDVSLMI